MNKKLLGLVFSLTLMVMTACVPAVTPTADTHSHSDEEGIEIHEAWARPASLSIAGPTPTADSMGGMGMSGVTSAVYLTIHNHGGSYDTLLKVSSPVATLVELHNTKEENGVMMMAPVEKIEIAPDGEVELKPGGYHIMLIGLKQDLKVGDTVKLTLTFEHAGDIEVEAEVKQP